MTDTEMLQHNIEEFSRMQDYLLLAEKDSPVYKALEARYKELKIILNFFGVDVDELDRIKD